MQSEFEIKKEKVLGLLNSIKLDKSPGPDGIYPSLLRERRGEIAAGFTKILASSMTTGNDPEDWRAVNAVPLFKKGSRGNSGNYRPVSLTEV